MQFGVEAEHGWFVGSGGGLTPEPPVVEVWHVQLEPALTAELPCGHCTVLHEPEAGIATVDGTERQPQFVVPCSHWANIWPAQSPSAGV